VNVAHARRVAVPGESAAKALTDEQAQLLTERAQAME
jgi:hypothetical protein